MAILSKVEVSGKMKDNLGNLLRAREITLSVMTAQTKAAQLKAVKTVQEQLMRTVYMKANDWQTYDLYNAVTPGQVGRGVGDVEGRVFIAHTGHLAEFYYAAVVEKGSNNWFWWGQPAGRGYYGRHFMYAAQLLIRSDYFGGGVKARHEIIMQLQGRSSGLGVFEEGE